MGGTDDPSNIVELTIKEHAEAHKKLYEEYGFWQDYVAWQGLAKLSPKEDLVKILQSEGGKKCRILHPNPFKGVRTKTNFNLNEEHRQKVAKLANAESAKEKRKKTFTERKHQQKEKNSQFGKVWCVNKNATDLSKRKMYHKDLIPVNYISTTEWKEKRKNKNNNAYGRHWYNNGKQNFYLKPTDEIVLQLSLNRGRLTNK